MGDPLTSSSGDVDSQIDSSHDADHHRDVTHSRARRQGFQLIKGPDGYGLVWWEAAMVVLGGGLPSPSCDLDEIDGLLRTPVAERESWWV
jgi:hypothetical protein